MGLFKKRANHPDEIERLKAEIASMGARLHASDEAKGQLDTTVRGLISRLETPAPPPPEPPPLVIPAIDPAEIDKLNAKIERLRADIDASTSTADADPAEIGQLRQRLEQLTTRVDHKDSTPSANTDSAEIEQLHLRLEQLTARLDHHDATPPANTDRADHAEIEQLTASIQRLTERLNEVDQRISSISTELANQITELSDDIGALGGNKPATDEVVDELRTAQTDLAAEQARYQIAFRQDLAELADRLRRA